MVAAFRLMAARADGWQWRAAARILVAVIVAPSAAFTDFTGRVVGVADGRRHAHGLGQ